MYLKRIFIISLIGVMAAQHPCAYAGFGVPGSRYLLEEINSEAELYISSLDVVIDQTLADCNEAYQEFAAPKKENYDADEFTETITQIASDLTVDITEFREHADGSLKEMQVDLNELAGYPVKNPTLQQLFISEIAQSLKIKSRRQKILRVNGCFAKAKHIVPPPLNMTLPPETQAVIPESAAEILRHARQTLLTNSINWVAYPEPVTPYRPPPRKSF